MPGGRAVSDPIAVFDEGAIKGRLKGLVRQTVEDTINALFEEGADALACAERYERTAGREAYRAGHGNSRKPVAAAGTVDVGRPSSKAPESLLWPPGATGAGRYRPQGDSRGDALAGTPVRRIEDIAGCGGARRSPPAPPPT